MVLRSFERILQRQDLTQDSLSGYDVTNGRPWTTDSTPDGVYYVIDHRCSACSRNLPFLNFIAGRGSSPVVIGVSYDDVVDLRQYVKSYRIAFPILANPQGRLASLIPGNLAPVTFVVSGGKVRDIFLGVLGTEERNIVTEFAQIAETLSVHTVR